MIPTPISFWPFISHSWLIPSPSHQIDCCVVVILHPRCHPSSTSRVSPFDAASSISTSRISFDSLNWLLYTVYYYLLSYVVRDVVHHLPCAIIFCLVTTIRAIVHATSSVYGIPLVCQVDCCLQVDHRHSSSLFDGTPRSWSWLLFNLHIVIPRMYSLYPSWHHKSSMVVCRSRHIVDLYWCTVTSIQFLSYNPVKDERDLLTWWWKVYCSSLITASSLFPHR